MKKRMDKMITSIQNKFVKEWKKLHKKKYRQESGTFLIEGEHMIEEAYETDQLITTLIVQEGKEVPAWMDEEYVYIVTENVFKEISQTEAPQGIAAIVNMRSMKQEHNNYVLLIDAIQDPGNLGTIIRTADAAGFSKVVLGEGTVDLYNDKVVRATQGSIFHLAIEQRDLNEAIRSLQTDGFSVWATTLRRAKNYAEIEPTNKTAIILGNEGRGVQQKWLDMADELVKIPMYGKAESLNVGIAAGILMYHIRK